MEVPHDIKLYQRIQRGDRRALNELFDMYYSGLCRFACSYVSFSESEELVSDVFFNLWKQHKSLKIEKSLRAYLYASVRYACYKLFSGRKLRIFNIDELEDQIDKDLVGPHETLVYQEFQQQLSVVIHKLPPRCRQIFIMNRFDNLKYKEIADILSISEKTVENQIVKALGVVRVQLQQLENA